MVNSPARVNMTKIAHRWVISVEGRTLATYATRSRAGAFARGYALGAGIATIVETTDEYTRVWDANNPCLESEPQKAEWT